MSAARDLAKLGNTNALKVDTIQNKVGVDSTSPVGELQVGAAITMGSLSGIISATAFYGDGSNLDGVSSAGLGTALSETDGDAAKLIYYTDSTLGIGSTVNIKVPTGSDVAYTQYTEIAPEENVDFIVSDGDDFIPDVLGISTAGGSSLTGSGGRIRAGSISNRAADGAPQLTYGAEVPVGYGITGDGGINIAGFATAGGFVGALTGNVTGNVTGNASGTAGGLTGTPDITINNLTGVAATFTGVLTYEDVTNVDSTGIVTARGGVKVGAPTGVGVTIGVDNAGDAIFDGIVTAGTCFKAGSVSGGAFGAGVGVTITGDGNAVFSGITTVTNFEATGTLVEAFSSTTTAYSSSGDLNISNGNLQFCSANLAGTNNTLNIMSTTGINTDLATGQALNVTAITAVNAATAYVNAITIDGQAVTESWVGGSAPSDGGSSGYDTYSFNILKTGSETFICIANQVKGS